MTKEEKQQYNILILEDDPDTQQHICKIVQNFGYKVSGTTASYDEAIASANVQFPHVALCDINLEDDKDGIDVAKTLKAMGNVAIIYLTMHSEDSIVEEALLTSPESYLLKNSIIMRANQLDIEIQKTVRNLAKNKISLKSRGAWYEVDYQDVLYIEADNNNCNIVTNQMVFNVNQKFGAVLEKFSKFRIQQIHRSVAVNLSYVKSYDRKKVHLNTDKLTDDLGKRERASIKNSLGVSGSFRQSLEDELSR